MAEPARHLHLAQHASGVQGCPACGQIIAPDRMLAELRDQVDGLLTEIKSLAAKNRELKRNRERTAKRSAAWPVAERLFVIWVAASGRNPEAKNCPRFRLDRYERIERFLRDGSDAPAVLEGPPTNDFERCAAAIIGRCFDHFQTQRPNGSTKRFHEWERIFADSGEFDDSLERRPRDWRTRLADLDPGPVPQGIR